MGAAVVVGILTATLSACCTVIPGAVVAGEDDQSVFKQPVLLQGVHDLPYAPVHLLHTVAINTCLGCPQPLLAGVGRPVGEGGCIVQEEGAILVVINELGSHLGQFLGHAALVVRLVVDHLVVMVDPIWVIVIGVECAVEEIKPPVIGALLLLDAQVPLAHQRGLIARLLQHLGQEDLIRRQAIVLVGVGSLHHLQEVGQVSAHLLGVHICPAGEGADGIAAGKQPCPGS